MVSRQRASSLARSAHLEKEIYRKYYTEIDIFLSPEGLLKVLSALACIVCGVLVLSALEGCGRAALLAGGSLASAAALAALYAGVALGAPLHAPEAWLYTDIIMSTVTGVLLLVIAVLSLAQCELVNYVSYIHGPLSLINSGMVTASAVITYVSVMRLQDAAHRPTAPPAPVLDEQEA